MNGNPDPQKSAAKQFDDESLDSWGFRDSRLVADAKGIVTMTGHRYELSGKQMPSLLPWMSEVLEVPLDPTELNASHYPRPISTAIRSAAFESAIASFLKPDQIATGEEIRLRHGHGHNQEEIYAIKYGNPGRVPDLVVWPADEAQVVQLMEAAVQHNVCLIPFGGGTNVSGALHCPQDEKRTIVSIDMRRMNRIISVDPVNRTAHIESGATGAQILAELRKHGLTLGHEPDSFEFSTLGGWIATHASGMKKNKYGNIENLLLDMRVVTPLGMLDRASISPRESIGSDPRRWILGSEGNFGIVTSAVVKLFPLPEAQHYGSIVFPSFNEGVGFMYDLAQLGNPPASVRLVDNLQFHFSQALKTPTTGLRKLKSRLERFVVEKVKGFDLKKIAACTLLFEGTAHEVAAQEREVYRIGTRHGGMNGGSENGRRGYQMTFSIAYIRDFAMDHYILSESFETSVPWSRLTDLCDNVKRRVWEEHRKHNLPGVPFISCRVTQLYESGACIYFYFGFYYKGVANPSETYAAIENAAREEILKSGGSLSHHHGVGKLRQQFLPSVMSQASIDWIRRSKQAIDPQNIMGTRNQALGLRSSEDRHPSEDSQK